MIRVPLTSELNTMLKQSLFFTFLGTVLAINTVCADSHKSAENTESAAQTKIATTDDDYDSVKENVEMAITDRGLIVSGTLHISDMLNRTAKDLGIEKPIYKKAEGIEFCSAKISHKMAQVDPTNVSMCPFTVVIYQLNSSPEKTNVVYRFTKLNGDGAVLEKEITDLLQGIVEDAVE